MKQTVETHHPFAHFLFKENFINSHEEASYSKSFVQIPYFTGAIDKTPHMITEIRMFSFNNTSPVVCDAKTNYGNDALRALYKEIETGDQLTLRIQYPVGTKVSTKFLSALQSIQTYVVTSNEASNPHIAEIRMLPYGICFAEDGCEVERVVLTDLDGKTRDYTEEVQEFKKYMRTYTFVDGGYMIPKNTASITFTYKKIPAEK